MGGQYLTTRNVQQPVPRLVDTAGFICPGQEAPRAQIEISKLITARNSFLFTWLPNSKAPLLKEGLAPGDDLGIEVSQTCWSDVPIFYLQTCNCEVFELKCNCLGKVTLISSIGSLASFTYSGFPHTPICVCHLYQ